MPDPAGTKTDGGIKFGSQAVTIQDSAGADQIYILDEFSLEEGSKWIERQNEVGVPVAQAGMATIPTGTATAQFVDTNTKKPKLFATFVAVEAGGANVTLVVEKVGQTYGADKEAKLPLGLRKILNP